MAISPKQMQGVFSNRQEFIIEIVNKGNRKIDFGVDNIYVFADGGLTIGGVFNLDSVTILDAYGNNELLDFASAEKKRQNQTAFLLAIAAGVNQQQGATALSDMQIKLANKTESISNSEFLSKEEEYANHALKYSAINPGGSLGGYFAIESADKVLDAKRGVVDLKIIVITGEKEHEFYYAMRKVLAPI